MFPIRDHNPSGRTPFVVYALIMINVVAYLAFIPEAQSNRELYLFYADWALTPRAAFGEAHTWITSMFLHGSFMHILGNMLFLWIFGDNLEDEMGHIGFLVFYLVCGIAAGLAQVLSAPASPVPMVGASGAIAGVMGGYLLLFPRARVDVLVIIVIFFRIFPMPAWVMLGIWFGLQLFGGVGADPNTGGVAYWAHAGGFTAGLVLTAPLWLRRGGAEYWQKTDGHPPHPETQYTRSNVPVIRRRR